MNRSRRTAGTSLVEILVVIVVFLIGILAIVQIFPGGFRLLGLTKSQSTSTYLARTEIERLKARPDQLPDRIVPVRFVRSAGQLVAIVDSNRRTSDLGPVADGLTQAGHFLNGPDDLGPWRYNVGANNITRIVGESQPIPAPRPAVGAISGNLYYGGLMNLQFGPAVFNSEVAGGSLDQNVIFNVYANDLSLNLGVPPAPGSGAFRPYLYYCDQADGPGATLYLPQGGTPIRYRFAVTAYISNAGNLRTLEVLDYIITVPAGAPNTYFTVNLAALFTTPNFGMVAGDTFAGIQFESLSVAPLFERIPKGNVFGAGNPYEYKLLDDVNPGVTNANMGVLLFNPAGYNYYVPNAEGRRIPLTARVNYNVYDWGILRNDFRIPTEMTESLRLPVGGLKIKGNQDTDGRTYAGLGFAVANGAGGNQELDVVVQDAETGGIFAYNSTALNDPLQTAYRVDRSLGLVRFQDRNTATPELEVTLYEPGTWNPIQIDDARGRTVRVFYQSNQEFQVQVFKAAGRYIGVSGTPSNSGEAALGTIGNLQTETKLFFTPSDLGRHVSVNEAYVLWDPDASGPQAAAVKMMSFSGVVRSPRASDPVQLPCLDMDDVFGVEAGSGQRYAVAWSAVDETGKNPGWIVRGVRGASVGVRVLWNPQRFNLGTDATANMAAYDKWAANWRKATTETFLQKGGLQ